MRLLLTPCIAWFAGFAAYLLVLKLVFGESLGVDNSDFLAAVVWTVIVSALMTLAIYLPLMMRLRRKLRGVRPTYLFPLVGAALFPLPTIFIATIFGGFRFGFMQAMMKPEALLFHAMFFVFGIVFGLCFVWSARDKHA